MTIETRLKEFIDILDKATEGPWQYNRSGQGEITAGFQVIGDGVIQPVWIAEVDHANASDVDSEAWSEQRHNDGCAIVTGRNDGPTLAADAFAEIKRLKHTLNSVYKKIEDIQYINWNEDSFIQHSTFQPILDEIQEVLGKWYPPSDDEFLKELGK